MKKLTVRDYARVYGLSESAVRKQLRSGKLAFTKQIINNRETTLIIVEESLLGTARTVLPEKQFYKSTAPKLDGTTPGVVYQNNSDDEVQEAEIINDSNPYNIVSMENNTFDQLIKSIKEMADDRAKTEKEAYSKLEQEYFELKAKCSKLEEENKALIIESVQNDANYRISELKLKELEMQISNLNNKLDKTISDYEELKTIYNNEKETFLLKIKDKDVTIEQLLQEKSKLEEKELQETSKKSFWSALNDSKKL